MKLKELQAFYDFADCIVLLAGGTGVLGLELVHTLVECNVNGVILSRNPERAAKFVSEWMKPVKSQGRLPCFQGDVLAMISCLLTLMNKKTALFMCGPFFVGDYTTNFRI